MVRQPLIPKRASTSMSMSVPFSPSDAPSVAAAAAADADEVGEEPGGRRRMGSDTTGSTSRIKSAGKRPMRRCTTAGAPPAASSDRKRARHRTRQLVWRRSTTVPASPSPSPAPTPSSSSCSPSHLTGATSTAARALGPQYPPAWSYTMNSSGSVSRPGSLAGKSARRQRPNSLERKSESVHHAPQGRAGGGPSCWC